MTDIDLYRPPVLVVTVDEPTTFIDRSLPTASWWDEYEIQPGTYYVEFTNIDGTRYVPGKVQSGFVRPIAAYYAVVRYDAVLVRSYREARLLGEVRAEAKAVCEVTTLTQRNYAYTVAMGAEFHPAGVIDDEPNGAPCCPDPGCSGNPCTFPGYADNH